MGWFSIPRGFLAFGYGEDYQVYLSSPKLCYHLFRQKQCREERESERESESGNERGIERIKERKKKERGIERERERESE